MLRASIRIVAGQASEEAVGCELVDRSAYIDPSITNSLGAVDVTRLQVRRVDNGSLPAPHRFLVFRRADPAMTWLPRRSVNRIDKHHIYYWPLLHAVITGVNRDEIIAKSLCRPDSYRRPRGRSIIFISHSRRALSRACVCVCLCVYRDIGCPLDPSESELFK